MLRLATAADRAAIEAVMIASARQLSEGFYTATWCCPTVW